MGRFQLVVLLAAVAGCQPMYGKSSEKLVKVRTIPHKAVPEVDPPIAYVDDCRINFHAAPVLAVDSRRSTELVVTGDTTIQQAEKLKEPETKAKAVSDGIDHYSNALRKDPYNAEATLKLALAYDKVYRRGCALALLGRIAKLEAHPKFQVSARRVADSVADNTDWFKGYRRDAIARLNGSTTTP